MNKLLLPFTGMRAGLGTHLPSTFVGNDKTGVSTSASGVFDGEYVWRTRVRITSPIRQSRG